MELLKLLYSTNLFLKTILHLEAIFDCLRVKRYLLHSTIEKYEFNGGKPSVLSQVLSTFHEGYSFINQSTTINLRFDMMPIFD